MKLTFRQRINQKIEEEMANNKNTFGINKEREKEILSGLEYLVTESKAAKRELDISSSHDRLQKKVFEIDERLTAIEELLIKLTQR